MVQSTVYAVYKIDDMYVYWSSAINQSRMFSCLQENWLADVKKRCREREVPHDVAEAESLLKKHKDLHSDIQANRDK